MLIFCMVQSPFVPFINKRIAEMVRKLNRYIQLYKQRRNIYRSTFVILHLRSTSDTRKVTHGFLRELIWTLVPTFILFLLAIPSLYMLYNVDSLLRAQEPFVIIRVIGNQWFWSYEYFAADFSEIAFDSYMLPESDLALNGLRLLETDLPLCLPSHTAIRFLVTSNDVLHCWAVPSLGIKIDACPGRINQVFCWILRDGEFFGQCSEICGVNHGFMPINIISVTVNK